MVLMVRGLKGRREGGLGFIRNKENLEIKYINDDNVCYFCMASVTPGPVFNTITMTHNAAVPLILILSQI
jgi:hypothetical protein